MDEIDTIALSRIVQRAKRRLDNPENSFARPSIVVDDAACQMATYLESVVPGFDRDTFLRNCGLPTSPA